MAAGGFPIFLLGPAFLSQSKWDDLWDFTSAYLVSWDKGEGTSALLCFSCQAGGWLQTCGHGTLGAGRARWVQLFIPKKVG